VIKSSWVHIVYKISKISSIWQSVLIYLFSEATQYEITSFLWC
jgi:hypothetical protein